MEEHVVESSAKLVLDLNDKIRVLHVDDDSGILKIAKQCLEMEGPLQVDTALSVEEALVKLKNGNYDIVVSDYQMPGKDGLDFLKTLRTKGNSIPFIMFTGKGREEVAIKALNLGANQYLNKTGETETVYMELAHSITELAHAKRTEAVLESSEQKYRDLFENSKDLMITYDLKGNLTAINKVAMAYGFARDEHIGRNMLEFVPEEQRPKLREEIKKILQGNYVENEIEVDTPKGKRILDYIASPIRDGEKIVGIYGSYKDITDRKKTELELFDRQKKLENVLSASPEAIVLIDLNGKIIENNEQAKKMFGYSSDDEVRGRSGLDFIAQRDRKRAMENIQKTLKEGLLRDNEYAIVTKDGCESLARISSSVVKDAVGNPTNLVIVMEDIAERKKAEKALHESEAKYRELVDFLPEMVFELDNQAHVTFANKRALELTGYSNQELSQAFDVNCLVAPEDLERSKENMKKMFAGQMRHSNEYTFVRKDGTRFPVCLSSAPTTRGGKIVGARGIIIDITKQKETEKALREARATENPQPK